MTPLLSTGIDESTIVRAKVPYISSKLDRVDIHWESRSFDFAVEEHEVDVHDMRYAGATLDCEGFAFVNWPSDVVRNRRDELIAANAAPSETMPQINFDYFAELQPLIEQIAAGAREVFAQYGTITVRFSSQAAERSWMTTSAFAHFDFESSEMDKLLADTLALTGRSVRPFSRQVLFQTWRGITDPPQDRPLVLCDGRTVSAGDIIPMDFHGPKGSRNELVRSRAGKYNRAHRWSYLSNQSVDEVLLFKGYDSASPDAGNAMHTAFDNPAVTKPVPRGSIEGRFIALYD